MLLHDQCKDSYHFLAQKSQRYAFLFHLKHRIPPWAYFFLFQLERKGKKKAFGGINFEKSFFVVMAHFMSAVWYPHKMSIGGSRGYAKFLEESYQSFKSRYVEKIKSFNDLLITFTPSFLDDAYPLDPPLMLIQKRLLGTNKKYITFIDHRVNNKVWWHANNHHHDCDSYQCSPPPELSSPFIIYGWVTWTCGCFNWIWIQKGRYERYWHFSKKAMKWFPLSFNCGLLSQAVLEGMHYFWRRATSHWKVVKLRRLNYLTTC